MNKKKIGFLMLISVLGVLLLSFYVLKSEKVDIVVEKQALQMWPYDVINYHPLKLQDQNQLKTLRVAVIDTGIDKSQSCLKDINVKEYKLTTEEDEDVRHGTLTMGALCNSEILNIARDDQGALREEIEFISIDIGSDQKTTIEDLKKGVSLATEMDVDVINVSMGTYKDDEKLRGVIEDAFQKGITIVSAAGNHITQQEVYPCSYNGVICVGAVNKEGGFSFTSNFGNQLTLSAPGEKITTGVKDNTGREVFHSGTSGAATIVTSSVILFKVIDASLDGKSIKGIFEETSKNRGEKRHDKHYGWGILDVGEAIGHIQSE